MGLKFIRNSKIISFNHLLLHHYQFLRPWPSPTEPTTILLPSITINNPWDLLTINTHSITTRKTLTTRKFRPWFLRPNKCPKMANWRKFPTSN